MAKKATKKPYQRHNRIKVYLVELGVTQKELAVKLGITETALSKMCRNITQPSLIRLREIATILGINAQRLIVPTKEKKVRSENTP